MVVYHDTRIHIILSFRRSGPTRQYGTPVTAGLELNTLDSAL